MPIAKNLRYCPATKTQISIAYEEFGDPSDPPILFVPGLSATCRMYDAELTANLSKRGYRLICMDNRDVGQSTTGSESDADWPQPWLYSVIAPTFLSPTPLYTLEDMAQDAWALLDHLKILHCNLVGFSMGSMCVEWMLIQQPTRVLSLCAGTGTTSGPGLSSPPLWVRLELLKAPPATASAEELIDLKVKMLQKCMVPPKDEATAKADYVLIAGHARRAAERITYRKGGLRQINAILHTRPREHLLRQMNTEHLSVLIFHGAQDLVIGKDHAIRLNEVFKNSTLVMIENMGHFMESKFYNLFADHVEKMVKDGLKKQQEREQKK